MTGHLIEDGHMFDAVVSVFIPLYTCRLNLA